MSTDTTVIDIKYLSLGHRRDGKLLLFLKRNKNSIVNLIWRLTAEARVTVSGNRGPRNNN